MQNTCRSVIQIVSPERQATDSSAHTLAFDKLWYCYTSSSDEIKKWFICMEPCSKKQARLQVVAGENWFTAAYWHEIAKHGLSLSHSGHEYAGTIQL